MIEIAVAVTLAVLTAVVAAFVPELLQDAILAFTALSLGAGVILCWRNAKYGEWFWVMTRISYIIVTGLIAILVFSSPDGVLPDWRSYLYVFALAIGDIGLWGIVWSERSFEKRIAYQRPGRTVYSDESAQVVGDAAVAREDRQREERRDLSDEQTIHVGKSRQTERTDLEDVQEKEE